MSKSVNTAIFPLAEKAFTDCSSDPVLKDHENVTQEIRSGSNKVAAVLKCVKGYSWLSGHSVRFTECWDGSWTTVFDICTEVCVLEKDCSKLTVADKKLNWISPDGEQLTMTMAECITSTCNTKDGANSWTLIGRRNMSVEDANYTIEVTGNMKAPSQGDRIEKGMQYFIGTHNLHAISKDMESGLPIPQVLRIEMTTAADSTPLHITYFGVTFDIDGFVTLTGEYHGNVENCWNGKPKVSLTDPLCNLFDTKPTWGTVSPQIVKMYVTPLHLEQESSCPALNLTDTTWLTTNVTAVPLERCPGSVVSFECIGIYMTEGSTKQPSGNAECLADNTWDMTPILPCEITCPDGYTASVTGDYCFKMPEVELSEGLKTAIETCDGLLWIQSQDDILNVPEDEFFYYTGHVGKEASRIVRNLTAWDIQCDGSSCQVLGEIKCLALSRTKYKIIDCQDSSVKALCRTPAVCPRNYKYFDGYCYRVIQAPTGTSSDFIMAATACSNDSAALAYPESQGELDYIVDLVSAFSTEDVKRVQLGIHDVNGDWTLAGSYAPDSDVLGALGPTEGKQHWRFMETSSTGSVTFIAAHYTETSELAVCRYPDIIGTNCKTLPLDPTTNMKPLLWANITDLETVASYSCYPGYFFDGNITASVFHNVSCMGPLGEWYLEQPLPECLVANVCLSELPVPPTPGTITYETTESRFLNGTVSFSCPELMALASANVTQNITCISPDQLTYAFSPAVLEPCFHFCWDDLIIDNATTTWNASLNYIEGSNVTSTCIQGHEVTPGNTVQLVNCTSNGTWVWLPCYQACVDPPPEAGSMFMAADPSVENKVGTVLNYTCNEGYFIPVTLEYPDVTTIAPVTCNGSGIWELPPLFDCVRFCPDDPLPAPAGVNNSWNGVLRDVNAEVDYTCTTLHHIFSDGTALKTLTCSMANTLWEGVTEAELVCVVGTTTPPIVPGLAITSATLEPLTGPFYENDTITYNCEPGMKTASGETSTVLTFTASGWSELDPNFICYPETYSPPSLPPLTAGEQGHARGT
ncbi:LOW QUALITY PROTEIN: uncharacterized protein [Palaemon carinicauda]|uniref:LOW QUALITY PROTEIN: uncharacterized protein n=1 Tax=Palaemon carinicauda TaxID=392227 RepID=UPI0035B67937